MDIEELHRILSFLIEHQTRWLNYGTWCVDLISTGENIGWFTLKPVPSLNDEFEVGYRLKKNKASQNVIMKSGLERAADIPSPFANHFIGAMNAKFEILKPN